MDATSVTTSDSLLNMYAHLLRNTRKRELDDRVKQQVVFGIENVVTATYHQTLAITTAMKMDVRATSPARRALL